jgi:cell division protein FtsB
LSSRGGVSIQAIVQAGYSFFWGLTKKKLIEIIVSLREEYTKAQAQTNKLKDENARLKDENTKLKEELKQHKIKGAPCVRIVVAS